MSSAEESLQLRNAIKTLHARKDKAYGRAWKRRGELISILPNIARKVDRLDSFEKTSAVLVDEHLLDTAIDLYVYGLKYQLFLGEFDPKLVDMLPLSSPIEPLTDHYENFDQLVDAAVAPLEHTASKPALMKRAVELFERLWPEAQSGAPPIEKFKITSELVAVAWCLIEAIGDNDPLAVQAFVSNEAGKARSEVIHGGE